MQLPPPQREELFRGRGQNLKPPAVDQRSVAAALGRDEIAVERLRITIKVSLKLKRVVHLVGVACPDRGAYCIDAGPVFALGDLRPPWPVGAPMVGE